MSAVEPTSLAPFRVLVVENDRAWQMRHMRNLSELWKYEAHAAEARPDAEDRFQDLWLDAISKAHDLRCHLALVDLRLRGDNLIADTTGKELVPLLAPTVSILVSAFGDPVIVNDALKSSRQVPQRAYAFVTKSEGPEALRAVIREVEQGYWRRRPLTLTGPDELQSAAIMRRFKPNDATVPLDEVDDVLRRLFPTAKRLKLEAISPAVQTSGLLLRHRSVVAKVYENDYPVPLIIKLARKDRSTTELDRFDQVRRYIRSGRLALPESNPIELWDIGGIKYNLVNSDTEHPVVTFSTYYADPQHTPKLIGKALENFAQFWHDLYRKQPGAPEPTRKTLFRAYTNSWGENWCKRLWDYRASPWLERYPAPIDRLGLGNPIEWLIRQVKLEPDLTYDDSALPLTALALTHGDLHGDNMFVDTRQDVWVIDYERTGFGPILQDWVELETDILTHLAELNEEDWAEYLQLLLDVLSTKAVTLSLPKAPASRYSRERLTIVKLRKLAADSSGEKDGQPHLYGLLFNALFRLTLLLEEHEERQALSLPATPNQAQAEHSLKLGIQRCLVMAGLARHCLDHWHQTWPPHGWQAAAAPAAAPPATPAAPAPPRRPRLRLQLTELHHTPPGFRVEALDIANQEPRATSPLPYRDEELVAVMKLLEMGQQYRADEFYPPQTAALQALGLLQDGSLAVDWCDRIGDRLFKALIPAEGGVRGVFERTFNPQRAGGELQITVDSEAAQLACFPWEMLYDAYPTGPRGEIDVVRHISSARAAQPLEVSQSPCGILYVSARPRGFAPAERDEGAIRDSIARPSHRRFVFEPLPEPTHHALKARLLDGGRPPVHVLHFDGHGTFARLCPHCRHLNRPHGTACGHCDTSLLNTPPRGWLLFETPDGEADPVDTVSVLEGIPRSEVRLVVLASCQSARVRGADLLLAGVGPGLILGGVPAVVAMQFSIAAGDAIDFNKEFYRALNQKDSLPQAVNRARKLLREPARWSPVLYLRAQDAQDRLCI